MSLAALFNPDLYLLLNPDVAAAVARGEMTAEQHFENYGKAEGRIASLWFDPAGYLAQYPDVAEAVAKGLTNAYDHFAQYGMAEGRAPFPGFDAGYYLEANPDVALAVLAGYTTAAQHFAQFGAQELRDFNPAIDMTLWRDSGQMPDFGAMLTVNPDLMEDFRSGDMLPFDVMMALAASVEEWAAGGVAPQEPEGGGDDGGAAGDDGGGAGDDGTGGGWDPDAMPDWLNDYRDEVIASLTEFHEDLMGFIDIDGLTAHVQQLITENGFDNPDWYAADGSGLMEPYSTQLAELMMNELNIQDFIDMEGVAGGAGDVFGDIVGGLPTDPFSGFGL